MKFNVDDSLGNDDLSCKGDEESACPPKAAVSVDGAEEMDYDTLSRDRKRRFCGDCGALWNVAWEECPHCKLSSGRTKAPGDAANSSSVGKHPLGLSLWLYFLLLGTSLVGLGLSYFHSAEEASPDFFVEMVDSVIVLLFALVSWRYLKPALSSVGPLRWYPTAIVFGAITFVLASLAVEFLVQVLKIEDYAYSPIYLEAGYGWGMVILVVCVQPAIIEELAFRGLMLPAFQQVLGLRDAVIVSSFLFMILHLAPLSFPHLLLIGLVLSYLRVRSGSLYPCVLMHFTHNLLIILTEMA